MNSEKQLGDLVRKLSEMIDLNMEVKIPCVVTDVITRKKVTVRPLIKILDKNGNTHSREKIEGVPVSMFGAGGKFISFPVAVGDIGWLEANDRDISVFLQSYGETEPPTKRMHSFSDGVFVPDIMDKFNISSEDDGAVVMQNLDGSVKIALDDSEVRVVNDEVNITINSSMVTGIAPGGFNLNNFIINADGSATSPVSVTAPNIIAVTSLTVAGVEMAGHDHGGVESGNKRTTPVGA